MRTGLSKKMRFEVLARDSFTCRYCGSSAPDVELHVDHVKPVAKGGRSAPGNLVTSCVACNQGKSDGELVVSMTKHKSSLRLARETADLRVLRVGVRAAVDRCYPHFDEAKDMGLWLWEHVVRLYLSGHVTDPEWLANALAHGPPGDPGYVIRMLDSASAPRCRATNFYPIPTDEAR